MNSVELSKGNWDARCTEDAECSEFKSLGQYTKTKNTQTVCGEIWFNAGGCRPPTSSSNLDTQTYKII